MSSTIKKSGSTAPATLGDSLVDFGYVATQVFMPSRGREVGITRNGLDKMIERGAFPAPIKFPTGNPKTKHPRSALRWRLSELRQWLESQVAS